MPRGRAVGGFPRQRRRLRHNDRFPPSTAQEHVLQCGRKTFPLRGALTEHVNTHKKKRFPAIPSTRDHSTSAERARDREIGREQERDRERESERSRESSVPRAHAALSRSRRRPSTPPYPLPLYLLRLLESNASRLPHHRCQHSSAALIQAPHSCPKGNTTTSNPLPSPCRFLLPLNPNRETTSITSRAERFIGQPKPWSANATSSPARRQPLFPP